MATSGFAKSASVSPVAFNIARAGAREIPFLIASLCMLSMASAPKIKKPRDLSQVRGAYA